jgi:magnesium chelatase family protein
LIGHHAFSVHPIEPKPITSHSSLPQRRPSILAPLTFKEALEATKIHPVAGVLDAAQGLVTQWPFRSPHHTISNAGLIGGGIMSRSGKVSLAHNGLLFLDELPEFPRNVLEVMRQPLEYHTVTIARASMSLTFPARFMLKRNQGRYIPLQDIGRSLLPAGRTDLRVSSAGHSNPGFAMPPP